MHLGLPVRVGGLVVSQGDLLHGDANGISSVPVKIADEIVDVADEFVAAEKIVLDYARGPGEKTPQGLGAARDEFSAVVAKLRDRVCRKS